jgi:acyl-CoA reductase-like NAD-dependent aldehyde dehydrogenase
MSLATAEEIVDHVLESLYVAANLKEMGLMNRDEIMFKNAKLLEEASDHIRDAIWAEYGEDL